VTNGLGIRGFLFVINDDHASILHGYRDTRPQRYQRSRIWLCNVTWRHRSRDR